MARIIVGWDPQILSGTLVFYSEQMFVIFVEILAKCKQFYVAIVYGKSIARERAVLWSDLRMLFPSLGNFASVLMGDFNVVRRPDERLEGFNESAAADFNSCLEDKSMHEMVTKGYWFTWSNKRSGLGDSKSELDRVVVNDGCMDLFRESEVVGHAPEISDHCAVVLNVVQDRFKACPFKFFNFWMADKRFKDHLISSWDFLSAGNPMEWLSGKLKNLKPVLKAFHKQHYSNLSG